MKAYKYLFFIGILFHNVLAFNAVDKTKSFKVSPGGELSLQTNLGEIRITTWDKNEVQITIKGLYEDDSNNLGITQEQNNISINYNAGGDELMFIINAPVKYNQDLRTMSGDITISGDVKGSVKAITSGGDLKTDNIEGPAELNTLGGDISSGNISGDAEIATSGGDILLGRISGKADIMTMGGDITVKDIDRNANIKTQGGDIKIGNTGGDTELLTLGGDIRVKHINGSCKIITHGGDIDLDGAKGKVDAKSSGGDLKLLNVTGSIEANTASGNIIVELTPEITTSSKIVTQNGGITFRIPDMARAEITANVRTTGSSHNDEETGISSDFTSKSHEQNSHKLKDVFLLNGGGAKIYLESNNSGIEIRKLIN